MFTLNESKLREALDDENPPPEGWGWVDTFDPLTVETDELHRIVDDCLERGVIEKQDPGAMMAVYPLSTSEPDPLLSVNPGTGPMLLGSTITFSHEDQEGEPVEVTVKALASIVDDANGLYSEWAALVGPVGDGGPLDTERGKHEQVAEDGGWAARLDGYELNSLAARVIGEDKVSADLLVGLLNDAGIEEDE